MYDAIMREYLLDHGCHFAKDGIAEIPKKAWANLSYTGKSIRDPSINTLMIPSVNGCCLLFENKHFRIVK